MSRLHARPPASRGGRRAPDLRPPAGRLDQGGACGGSISTRRLARTIRRTPAARAISATLLACLVLLSPGCGGSSGDRSTTGAGASAENAPAARRIVSLAPSLTEILFAVGAGGRVVAVTDLCDYPPAARALPKVGGLTSANLQLESVVAARPDLVVSVGLNQEEAVAALRRLGLAVEVVATDGEGLAAVPVAVRRVGALAGRPEAAEGLARELEARLVAVDRALADLPPQARPRVYFEVWDRPLMTTGPDTFLGELVARAGGENVFADVRGRYVQISPEAVLARRPEVILTPSRPGGPRDAGDFADRPGWTGVPAVADGRVHLLDGDLVSRPGPRVVEAVERAAALLHPERFAAGAAP